MDRKPTAKTSIVFERSEEVSLPVNMPPARMVMGQDWRTLKRLAAQLKQNNSGWQRTSDFSFALFLSLAGVAAAPNNEKVRGVSVRLLFGMLSAMSLVLYIASMAALKTQKQYSVTDKQRIEEWITDVEDQSKGSSVAIKPTTQLVPDHDVTYDEAVALARELGTISTSKLQRKLRIGYSKAARFIEMMEEQGIVGESDGARPREVLKK